MGDVDSRNRPVAMMSRVERATHWVSPQPPDLHDAFAHAPAALAVTTLAGTITAANAALADLLGRDPAALVGNTLLEVTHPDDVTDALRCDTRLPVSGCVFLGERRFCRGDGQVIWVRLTLSRLPATRGRHAAGDAVLVQLAARIRALTRVGDTAARLGGDEFAVLCEDTPPGLADTIASRLRRAAAQPFHLDGVTATLSASVGHRPVRGENPTDVLRGADERMYQAKRRSRGALMPVAPPGG